MGDKTSNAALLLLISASLQEREAAAHKDLIEAATLPAGSREFYGRLRAYHQRMEAICEEAMNLYQSVADMERAREYASLMLEHSAKQHQHNLLLHHHRTLVAIGYLKEFK